MDRREFVRAGLAAGAIGATVGATPPPETNVHFYELRVYQLRNDLEPGRAQAFFKDHFVPTIKKHGAVAVGVFSPQQGMRTPALILLIAHRSLADMQNTMARMDADAAYIKARNEFENGGTYPPYERYESSLLRAFAGHPLTGVPATAEGRPARLYELRTYESKNAATLANKIDMFNQAEIQIFKNAGMETVFFGEAVCGTNLPHLTYMLGYDNMAARDTAWGKFGNSEEWKAIRNRPGWTDPEAVSNITAVYLRPAGYSDIK